ncbi:MAG: hypothetical protein FJ149_01910 [Euryarchaeota archaeon]|nr:hypothetical protein [Euryarchaeota archaeon]
MIVTKEKPLEEMMRMLQGRRRILVLGCDGCTQPPRGLREAQTYRTLLEMALGRKGGEVDCVAGTVSKQCDTALLAQNYPELVKGRDAVLSLSCALGVQLLSLQYPEVPVFPGQNTVFLGYEHRDEGWLREACQACGDCVLGETGGICPVARCSKSLLNGPCGGSHDGKCEVRDDIPCAWQLIHDRLRQLDRNEWIDGIVPPRDWRSSRDGGVRYQKKDEDWNEPARKEVKR